MQNRTIEWLAALLALCLLLGVAPVAAFGMGIQEQINAASPGDTISIGSGTYNETVIVNKTITLIGEDTGGGMPVVDGGYAGSTITVTADDVVIEGFEITGSDGDCPEAGIAVEADNVVIRNNVIVGNDGHGIWFDDASGTIIEGNDILENWLNGIAGEDAVDTVISDNTIDGNYYNGIRLWYGENTLISGNTIGDSGENGIVIWYSADTRFAGNTITESAVNGLLVKCSYDTTVDGNTVSASGEYNILLRTVIGATVTDNTVTDAYMYNIRIFSDYPVTITGNTVSGSDDYPGLGVTATDDYTTEEEEWADENSPLHEMPAKTLIADNTATDNEQGIVTYEVDDVVITGNDASNNECLGIHVYDGDNVEVSDNVARLNGYHGVKLDYVTDSAISGNTATDNGKIGIVLKYASAGNTITRNTASGVYAPVFVDDDCYGNEIYLNDFVATEEEFEIFLGVMTQAEAGTGDDKNECKVPGREKKNLILDAILGLIPRGEGPSGDDTLWNSPEAWHYKYNDRIFLNFTGNYWYDYNGTDANGDGIGDTPHEILTIDCYENEADLGTDFYPLMESYTQYPEVKMLKPEGGSDTAEFDFVTDGTVLTSFEGKVYQTTTIASADGVAKLTLPRGTVAFDADGNPIREITIEAVDEVPAAPEGAVFTFAGYAYECTPAGATFDPAITLTFTLTAEEWEALEGDLTVRFYNAETGEWEDVPATYDPVTHTVTAEVSHFTVFALFAEGTAETAPAAETTTAAPTAAAEPAETTAEATTAAPAEPTETPASPLVFAPVLGLLAFLFFARRH